MPPLSMSELLESDPATPPSDKPAAGPFSRFLALAGGLLILLVGVLVSFGLVLLAPVAMGGVALVQHRRGRRLTRTGGAIAAGASVTAGVVLAAGLIATAMPRGTWRAVQHAADSASAASAKAPPPAWVTRLAPAASLRATQTSAVPPGLSTAALAWGAAIALVFFATFYGVLGWGAGMLLGFAVVGRWPGARAPADGGGGGA